VSLLADVPLIRSILGGAGGGGLGPRTGAVIANGKYLQDEQGLFRPLGLTFFSLIWGVRHDADRYRANAEWAAAHGVHAPRILGEVGGSSWADRVIDPRLDTYEGDLAQALALNASLGMRTILSIFGGGCVDSQGDVDRTVEKVINVVGARRDQVLMLEIANEDNFPGSNEDMARVARRIRSALPSVVLAPCALDLETTAQWCAPDMCNEQNLHQERQPGDLNWRQARQLWDTGSASYSLPCAALEPMGVLLMQGEDLNDPVRLAFCWAVGCFQGYQTWVLHSGPGVRTGGQYDVNMGRASNFYDIDTVLGPCAAMLLHMQTIVPLDVANWVKTSQRGRDPWPDNFLYADMIWSDEGSDHGVSRNYVAYGGGQFCCLTYGVKHYVELLAKRTITATLHDLRSGTATPITIPAGGRHRLAGNAEADFGYVLVGTYA
jgi:hypothetical protein